MKHIQYYLFLIILSINSNLIGQTIQGTVKYLDGTYAIGANIIIEELQLGTTTDLNGTYKIYNVPKGKHTLKIKFIGYNEISKNINVSENKTYQFNGILEENREVLDQVIVVGYGTQVEKLVSSSVVKISADDINNSINNNFTSTLQGKASGVQITTDNGMAGSSTSIRIRGVNTLSGGAEPLYIIDGIPLQNNDISESSRFGYNTNPLSMINPRDIENITILKDASSTAIYGARGANGVILITTKKGKANKSKLEINYKTGLSTETNRLNMLSANQYVDLYSLAFENDGNDISNLNSINGIDIDSISNTDWIDEVLQIGKMHDFNLSFNAGNKTLNYFIGSSYKKESSFIKENLFERATTKLSLNYNPFTKLKINGSTNLAWSKNKYAKVGSAGGLGAAQSHALPIYPIYNDDGSYFWWDNGGTQNLNPVAELNLLDNRNNSLRSINNIDIILKINKMISINNQFSYDIIDQHERFFTPKEINLKEDSASTKLSTIEDRSIKYHNYNYNSILELSKKINNNNIKFLNGFNSQYSVEKYKYKRISGPSLSYHSKLNESMYTEESISGKGQEYAIVSFFSRINFDHSEKYLIEASYRTDGSSRFGSQNKFGHFGALSTGWIISEEEVLKNNRLISFLKIRTSVGTRGNDNIGNFNQYSFYSPNQNYAGNHGIGPDNPSVLDLRWETSITSDLGVDFSFLQNKISGTIELYNTKSNDVLVSNSPLSPSSGFTSVTKNIGKVQSKGIDFNLSSYNLPNYKQLKWKTELNISSYVNKVLDLGGATEVSGTNYGENRAIVGEPVGVFYLAEFAGIDPNTGKEFIYDLDGNIVELNATNSVSERKAMGKPYPDFYGGFNNSFTFKKLTLDFLFIFSVGQKIYDDHGKRQLGNMGYGWNQDIRTLDNWQNNNNNTQVPILSLEENRDINSSRHLHDASFIRLRNVNISYNLPESLCKKIGASKSNIFIAGQNLYVWTKYEGWDPEVNREGSGAITQGVTYLSPPQSKTITTGINIIF